MQTKITEADELSKGERAETGSATMVTPRVTPGVRCDHKLEAGPGSGLWGRIKRLHIQTVDEGMERSMGNERS